MKSANFRSTTTNPSAGRLPFHSWNQLATKPDFRELGEEIRNRVRKVDQYLNRTSQKWVQPDFPFNSALNEPDSKTKTSLKVKSRIHNQNTKQDKGSEEKESYNYESLLLSQKRLKNKIQSCAILLQRQLGAEMLRQENRPLKEMEKRIRESYIERNHPFYIAYTEEPSEISINVDKLSRERRGQRKE